MPKNFSEAILEIMPLVKQGSDLPFVISHESGNWNINYFALNTTAAPEEIKAQATEYIAFLREKDPYIAAHTGEDFARGSFAYVYDKAFCARLRNEYEAYSSGEENRNEINALINAVEDNIGAFSQKTLDYLLEFDQPLRALYELNPIPLYNHDNPGSEPYDEDRLDDFIGAVERKVDELTEGRDAEPVAKREADEHAEFSDAKVNEYDPTHIISSLLLNGVDIELGEDTENPLPFYIESNRGYDNLFSFRTDNYPEAVKTYTNQILEHVHEMTLDREDKAVMRGVEYAKLTDEHCLPDGKSADFTGKMIIVDANSLLPEYRSSTSQIVMCSHGNGARPNAKGRSVFGTELYTGETVVYDRSNILGIADESKLPQWAKVKLEIQRDPAVFEFGGYHFKPYHQFHKGEVERHLKGDSRPMKMDAAYAMRNMSSDRSLGISTYDWGKTDYSHEKFYAAANSEADIFICLENGKLYVPNENELYRYNEPSQKEQGKTHISQHKECASAIDAAVSAVRTPGEMAGTATYNFKTALGNLNERFGEDCVNDVLAAIVARASNDGRYSAKNKAWAAAFDAPVLADVQHNIRYCTVNTHPTVLDGLVNRVREASTAAREEKPDLLAKINGNKQKVERDKAAATDAPAKKKNRDGQEV